MHGNIDHAVQQGTLNLLGEHAVAADLSQGRVADAITGSLDLNQLHGARRGQGAQMIGDVVGLPQSQRAAARADTQRIHA